MRTTSYLVTVTLLVGALALATIFVGGIGMSTTPDGKTATPLDEAQQAHTAGLERATFGSGCFWCTEAVFQELKGVRSVVSGYSGGHDERPSYEQVCTGQTGHAEVVQISYDPAVVSFDVLLEVFWRTHDPTTLNRQGNDVGTQYRSVIFYHNDDQRRTAEQYKEQLDASGTFAGRIVTEIEPYRNFYPAEDYHQDYFALNPRQPYCSMVIRPKLEKFRKTFATNLKQTRAGGAAATRPNQ